MNTKIGFLGGAMGAALLCAIPLSASAQYYGFDRDTPYSDRDAPYAETIALWKLPDAAHRIDYATVEAPSGAYADEVRDVRTDFAGRPTRVGVALRDGNWVWLNATELRYDPDRNVLISDLSYNELQDMST